MTARERTQLRQTLSSEELRQEQRFLHAFVGVARFKILLALSKAEDGLTVRELAHLTRGTSSGVSHQLAVLRKYGVVYRESLPAGIVYRFNRDAFAAFCSRMQGHFKV